MMVDQYHKQRCDKYCISRLYKNDEGFTLLEVVLSLFMLGILTAIFGMGLVAAVQSYDFSRTNAHMAQKIQLAMSRLSRELMELTDIASVSSDGEEPYVIYERLVEGDPPSVMRFGIHHHPGDDTVRLYTGLSTGETSLGSATIGQGDPLIDGVSDLSMEFNEGAATWTLNAAENNIQLLSSIHLTMTLDRPDQPDKTQVFETTIHLRNNNNFGGVAPTATPASINDYRCFISILPWGSSL